MHISEGVLSVPVLVTGGVLTAVGVAIGLSKINSKNMPQAAIMTAVFFTASFIHVPIGPTSVHLMLSGITGLLMGWIAFPVILVGLTLQALLFQFGGLTVLGVNSLNVALPAFVFSLIFRKLVLDDNVVVSSIAAFFNGFLPVVLTTVMLGAALYFTDTERYNVAIKTAFVAHIPVMVIEGIVTVLVVNFLKKVKPDIIYLSYQSSSESVSLKKK
jgi:cobalt/nickel transport system permease protein